MKKTFLIITICLLSTLSFGQTKEETISWLKEKLETYLQLSSRDEKNLKVVSISSCEIVISYDEILDTPSTWATETFPTSGSKIDAKGNIKYIYDVILLNCVRYTNGRQKFYKNSSTGVNLINGEDNLYQRIEKALAHLATFCPKKKEAF